MKSKNGLKKYDILHAKKPSNTAKRVQFYACGLLITYRLFGSFHDCDRPHAKIYTSLRIYEYKNQNELIIRWIYLIFPICLHTHINRN